MISISSAVVVPACRRILDLFPLCPTHSISMRCSLDVDELVMMMLLMIQHSSRHASAE
jgi:hypothetical protein